MGPVPTVEDMGARRSDAHRSLDDLVRLACSTDPEEPVRRPRRLAIAPRAAIIAGSALLILALALALRAVLVSTGAGSHTAPAAAGASTARSVVFAAGVSAALAGLSAWAGVVSGAAAWALPSGFGEAPCVVAAALWGWYSRLPAMRSAFCSSACRPNFSSAGPYSWRWKAALSFWRSVTSRDSSRCRKAKRMLPASFERRRMP